MKSKKMMIAITLLAAISVLAFAQEAADFQWEVAYPFETGFSYNVVNIIGYTGSDTDVVIPREIDEMPVRGISSFAFANKGLTSVVIPDSVNIIWYGAFAYNELTSVIIPKVSAIWHGAFAYNKLTSIILPDSLQSIGQGAFAHNQLESITIPNSVYSLGAGAFAYNHLTSIILHGRPGRVEYATFASNPITSITIGNVTVGWEVFGTDNGFERAYEKGGRQAGTYTRPNPESTEWTWQ
jgi:hypothetical protein